MKKIFSIMLISLSFSIYSLEYNTYEMEVEHVFNASHEGEGETGDLSIFKGDTNPGAGGPGIFFIYDQFVIADQAYYKNKRKTIFFDSNYNILNVYEKSFYEMKVLNFNSTHIGYNSSYIKAFDSNMDWSLKFNITTYDFEIFRNYKDLYYQDNTLFIFDKDYKLWAIKNPGLDTEENRKNIISEDEIIKEINSGKFKGLSIDGKKRLFLNNKLLTVDIKTYTNYSREIRTVTNKPLNSFENSEDLYITGDASYIGADNDGNKYWYQGSALLIFNTNGWPIEDFVVSEWEKVDTYPAVSPEGDVYFMNYGEDKVTLYKVKRQW